MRDISIILTLFIAGHYEELTNDEMDEMAYLMADLTGRNEPPPERDVNLGVLGNIFDVY